MCAVVCAFLLKGKKRGMRRIQFTASAVQSSRSRGDGRSALVGEIEYIWNRDDGTTNCMQFLTLLGKKTQN